MACIWYAWTACECTATTSNTAVWNNWATTASTALTTTPSIVWNQWNATTASCGNGISIRSTYQPPPPPSPEELERRRIRDAEYAAAEEARKKLAAEADKRAEETLRRHLSGRQRRQYRRSKSFIVRGRDGHDYKVNRGWSGHVERLERGRAVERFCIHPDLQIPLPDNQLIAKLMLETEPDRFKRIANATQLAV